MSPTHESPERLPVRGEARGSHFDRSFGRGGERVVLTGHDPKWPYLFQREAERVREALGPAALAVEHVGSTAVPGLAARPCVDLLLLVGDPADEAAYRPALEKAGYVLHYAEPDFHDHHVFKGPDVSTTLHVFADGPEPRRILAFRDRLRADAGDRERYERAKRDLAERHGDSVQDYAEAKTGVIEDILSRAPEAGR
ncbi:GrpB family protein [Nocardiopsis chromatogenes]|uniref:GrpB family protein n=1 Tax=Nocardiopsis chromatogenes TaxID=280239 RepID=UPI0003489BA3|nr:GrpB family protein [Nocardiopsis chromatogenes]